jgi:sugar transferase (PEP-CTERM system associated)
VVQLFQRYVPYSSVLDFLVQSLLCLAAFTAAVQIAFYMKLAPTLPALVGVRAGRTMTTVAVLVTVFYLTGYFERRNHLTLSRFVPRLLHAVPLAAITLGLMYAFVPTIALPGEVAAAGLAAMTVLMVGWHALAPSIVQHDVFSERVIIIGDGGLARQIAACTQDAAPWGFRVAGYIPVAGAGQAGQATAPPPMPDSPTAPETSRRILPFPTPATIDAPALGRLGDIDAILAEHRAHTVVVALSDRRGKLPLGTLINAKLRGVQIFDAIEFYERLTGRMLVARMRPSTIIFADGFVPGRGTQTLKRFVDAALAAFLLVVTAPVLAVVAIAIRATSPGPAIFSQPRVGLASLPFTIYKFRTMCQESEADGAQWATENDSRITPLGRFLRKSRLDELPQLWNILLGQMSFVGPRPEQPTFVRTLRQAIPYYEQRHAVRPGLTGWAQVKYPYGASVAESEEKLEYDLYYIKRLSVAFDFTIMFETVRVMITGKGAR